MERLRDLVVIVPGIGGSVLEDNAGTRRWGPHADSIARSIAWPDRLGVPENPELIPVGLLPTITLVGALVVPGYDRLVRHIRAAFADVRVDVARPDRIRDLNANVLLFPYDFRLGVRHAAEQLEKEIAARIAGMPESARRRRVIILAHSMGGLVARYWLGPLGGAGACRALITVGTPHRGAPKALDWLLNGVSVGAVGFDRITEVLRGWPSTYDLLPRYPCVLDDSKTGDSSRQSDPILLYPRDLHAAAPDGFVCAAADAHRMHLEIEAAWSQLATTDNAPQVVAVLARGHATSAGAVLSGSRVQVLKTDPWWLPNQGWMGDGTVPANCAIPIEFGDDRRGCLVVPDRHMPMASSSAVVELLRSYSGESLAAMRGDEPGQPWLGLELDDVVPAGEPFTLGARLFGAQADQGTTVWVTVRSAASQPRRYRCAAAGEHYWRTQIEPLPPGICQVRVEAVGMPFVDRVSCADSLGVVNT